MEKLKRLVELFHKDCKNEDERTEFEKLFINLNNEEMKEFQSKVRKG